MAGPSSGVRVSAELQERLASLASADSPVSILQVRIDGEEMVEVTAVEGSTMVDYGKASTLVNNLAASYFLLRSSAKKWVFVSWIPEGLKVRDRTIYASSKDALKAAFGNDLLLDDVHITSLDEFRDKGSSFSKKQQSPSREELFSSAERSIYEARQQEETARKEQMKQKIGGYHAASMTLDDDALTQISSYKNESVNWLHFKVSSDQKSIVCEASKDVSDPSQPGTLDENEPGFYLYHYKGHHVFIYCCPGKSPTKLRMIYSTAKPAVMSNLQSQSIDIDRKMEVSDTDEVTPEAISQEISNQGRRAWDHQGGSGGGAFRSPSSSSSGSLAAAPQAHPIYGHAGKVDTDGSRGMASPRSEYAAGVVNVKGGKRIVLPPPVAYQ